MKVSHVLLMRVVPSYDWLRLLLLVCRSMTASNVLHMMSIHCPMSCVSHAILLEDFSSISQTQTLFPFGGVLDIVASFFISAEANLVTDPEKDLPVSGYPHLVVDFNRFHINLPYFNHTVSLILTYFSSNTFRGEDSW